MGCAMQGLAPTKDEHVGLFKIFIAEGRRIVAEALLVSRRGRGHALAGVAVAVAHAHADLRQSPEKGHLFGDDLTRAEEGRRASTVLLERELELPHKGIHRRIPGNSFEVTLHIAPHRCGGPVFRGERGQRLPAFWTGHAEIDRVIALRTEVDGLSIFQVDLERATRAAEATDAVHRGVRLYALRDAAEPVRRWFLHELFRQRAVECPNLQLLFYCFDDGHQ